MSAAREWSDLSAEARSAKVDAVAKQMVDARDDAQFAARIAARLPARRVRFNWLNPQLSGAAAIAFAVVLWFTRATPAPPASTIAMVPLRAAVDAVEPFRAELVAHMEPGTGLVEPVEPMEPMEPVDHERALPAAPAPGVITLGDLAPRELPALGTLTLDPLEVGELPLTGESFPPREFR